MESQEFTPQDFHDPFLDGNEVIEKAIADYYQESSNDKLFAVVQAIYQRKHENGHFLIPVMTQETESGPEFTLHTIQTQDGQQWLVAFTSEAEFEKGQKSQVIGNFIDETIRMCMESSDAPGFIINPWGQSFLLNRDIMQFMLDTDARSNSNEN